MLSQFGGRSTHEQRRRLAGSAIVIFAWLFRIFASFHGHSHQEIRFGLDYRSIYSSSRCLLDGRNPYSGPEMQAEFLAHGGSLREVGPNDDPRSIFAPYYVGYPPTSLFYFMPLASLPWQLSRHLWIVFSLTLYGLAALLFSELCSDYSPIAANLCLACFLGAQWLPIYLLQPTLLPAALCCIGIWSLLQGRFIKAGILCLAFSLVLKPHLGALPLLYFFLVSPVSRKRALQVVCVTVLLCVPGLTWTSMHAGTRHWVQNFSVNVKNVASRGHLSDPGPTGGGVPEEISDLQTIVSMFRDDPAYYNPAVWCFSLVLLAVWLYPALTLPSTREKDLLCLAAILTFSMLPIYHREYDSLVLLTVFPAIGFLLKERPRWGAVAASLSLVLSFVVSNYYKRFVLRPHLAVLQRAVGAGVGGKTLIALMQRPLALSLLILTVFFLVALYRVPRLPSGQGEMPAAFPVLPAA